MNAVLHLLAGTNPNVTHDKKKGGSKDADIWKTGLKLMQKPSDFMAELGAFKALIEEDKVDGKNFKACEPILANPDFTVAVLENVAKAAAGLCSWVININIFYNVFVNVEPKRLAVEAAKKELSEANANKAEIDELVAKLNAELQVLLDSFNEAMKNKQDAMDEMEKCTRKLNNAQRLMNALGAEQERWAQSIIDLGELLQVIIGDVLLASAFVSYVGPFNKAFRDEIINDNFLKFFSENGIPRSADPNPLLVLTDEA
jgi:dynein heavy chain